MRVVLALLSSAVVTGFRIKKRQTEGSAGLAAGAHTAGGEAAYDPTTLVQRRTTSWEVAYHDSGTGSDSDLQVWRPRLWPGEYRIMYTASSSYAAISHPTVVVKGATQSAIMPPSYFVCQWSDRGTRGDHDGSFWRPVAPLGYTCLSDVAVFMSNSDIHPGTVRYPDQIDSAFRCVKSSLVKYTDLGDLVWTDSGSGGSYDGAVWHIHHSDGMRVNQGGGLGRPPQQQNTLKEFTGGLFRGMERVTSVSNPNSQDQPPSSYAMTQGLSVSRSSENSFTVGMGTEIAASASAGVEGIVDASLSSTITTNFGETTTFSSTETSTTETQVTVNFNVPAHTQVDLWQLIVTDSEDGEGSFKIRSTRYIIEYVPI